MCCVKRKSPSPSVYCVFINLVFYLASSKNTAREQLVSPTHTTHEVTPTNRSTSYRYAPRSGAGGMGEVPRKLRYFYRRGPP